MDKTFELNRLLKRKGKLYMDKKEKDMTKHKFVCGKCGYTAIDMYGDYLHHPPETCISILMTKCENLKEINAELVEACEGILPAFSDQPPLTTNEVEQRIEAIEAAIAKAKIIR